MAAYDDMLDAAGSMGPWQMWTFGWIWFSQFFQAMTNIAVVFMQFQPKYKCDINEDLIVSRSADECYYTLSNGSTAQQIECQSFIYDQSEMTRTIVTQWDLVCSQKMRSADAQSTFMAGFFFGALLSGLFSDRFGRKKVVVVSGTATAILGILQVHTTSFPLFLICRFLLSLANVACYSTGFVLCMELTTNKHRDWIGGMFYIPYAMGYTSLSLFAYFLRDWRMMHAAISLPVMINLAFWWLLPESPRWMVTKGRMQHALPVLAKAAKLNGHSEQFENLIESSAYDEEEKTQEDDSWLNNNFLMIFKHRTMAVRCLLISLVWFVTSMVYYGISLNVQAFPGDIFAQNAIAGAMELPGYVLAVLLLCWGRRPAVSITLVIVGCCLIAIPMLPKVSIWLTVRHGLAMIGKLSVTATFAAIYVHTAELFPTVVRDSGMGVCNSIGRIGSMLAPYISTVSFSVVNSDAQFESMLIYGVLSLSAAAVSLCVPETRNVEMPETFEDAERPTSNLTVLTNTEKGGAPAS
uniref:Major facilitator superfamily (MFS) profile domain-containing protein n=1 Tax=Plectus sambesii TaxID=2011161 RepID=A0A914VYH4_9BILA